MVLSRVFTLVFTILVALSTACAPQEDAQENWIWEPSYGRADSSAMAVFLVFSWEGEVESNHCWNAEQIIKSQVLFTVGQLNGDNSVGRLDQLKVTNIEKEDFNGGCLIRYSASMPVAWARNHGDIFHNDVPESYALILPRNLSMSGQQDFLERYQDQCLDPYAHDVTAGIMWYYFRPDRPGCQLAADDVVGMKASVDTSSAASEGTYPEYDKIWEDEVFEVVAIFGKYKDDATSSDAGISAWNRFNREIQQRFENWQVDSQPSNLPYSLGVDIDQVRYEATHFDGRRMVVNAFLIDSVKSADPLFWNAYEQLTPSADFIVYNGHSGLGSNIRMLANRGEWETGQYAVVFLNGCDTYAYIDSALSEAHAEVNPDDPEGTLYVDIVSNAMPSLFRDMPQATMALVDALVNRDAPKSYVEIFRDIPSHEVVLVTGDQDNIFQP